jgi:hypothetical protein
MTTTASPARPDTEVVFDPATYTYTGGHRNVSGYR